MTRTSARDLHAAATAALSSALRNIGAAVREESTSRLVLGTPDGRSLELQPKGVSTVTPSDVPTLAKEQASSTSSLVVVGDLITESARERLNEQGIGWLDRRGHLRIAAPGVWVDTVITPAPRAPSTQVRPAPAIRGTSGIAAATAALLWGDEGIGVREIARRANLSPGGISTAMRHLREAGLITKQGGPRSPELFWALAEAWHPAWLALQDVPRVEADAQLVATGTRAAVALDAPLVARADYPVELLVADAVVFQRIRWRTGEAGAEKAAAYIAVAPTSLACDPALRQWGLVQGIALAHPLFVALELAADPGRGVEALEGWQPLGFPRVW